MDAVLGIDIAKGKFDVTLLWPDGRRRRKACPNSASGFAELLTWLQRQQVTRVHAAMEATGTYGEALATTLVDAGHQVSVLNPAVIHHYAQSRLTRAKTDRVDADLIADYTATQHPTPWTPLPREIRELQALVRRLDALLGMQTEERNRAQAGALTPAVQQSIAAVLAHLEGQIADVRQQIGQHMDHHPDLRRRRDLLTSIPGVGDATAAVLLAELFTKQFASARHAAAFAGVVPRVRDSGTLHGRRVMCKVGANRVRKGLYFPAIAALRWNPTVKIFGERLRAAGKPPMLVIGAAMRKLVHLAFGVLHSGRAYDPAFKKA
jgi:transposase